MEIIPIEYCDVCEEYVHLNQRLSECAFEHQCESGGTDCPFKQFFSKTHDKEANPRDEELKDMPTFYISDL